MIKFKSTRSERDLSPEKKFKEMIKSLKPGKKRRFDLERAISYLGIQKDKRATKSLIEVLKHSTSDFKSLACEALGKIGDESAIEALIQALGDFQVKYDAERAIRLIGEPAIEFLIQALDDKNKYVYEKAGDILYFFGEPSVRPLLKALEDEHPQVRMQAVIALGRIGDTRAAEPLYQVMVNDIDKNVEEEAVCALGKMKDKRSVEKLMEFLIFNSSTSKSREYGIREL
jgi:HEAT repeat protein